MVGRTEFRPRARADRRQLGGSDRSRTTTGSCDQVPVGTGPGRIAAGFGSLWVVNDFDNTVSRIDPATGTRADDPGRRRSDGDRGGSGVRVGRVRAAREASTGSTRSSTSATQRIPVGNGPSGIAISPGAVWVTNRLDDTVTEIDSKTGNGPPAHLDAGPSPSDIAYGLGALWIANESSSTVTRLDPRTGGLQHVQRRQRPRGGRGRVRLGLGREQPRRHRLADRSAPATPSRPRSRSVPGPSSVLASDGAIWVADSYGGRIVRIDPATNAVVRTIAVGSGPQSLASTRRPGLAERARDRHRPPGRHPAALRSRSPPTRSTTGVGYTRRPGRCSPITGDGLVGFKRVGGLDGGTLVPDLATSLPAPTNDGRTYTFQLRRGIRYSNGEPLRASDVRRALERAFRISSPHAGYYLSGASSAPTRARGHAATSPVASSTDDRAAPSSCTFASPTRSSSTSSPCPSAYPVPPEVSMTKAAPARRSRNRPVHDPELQRTSRAVVLVRNPRFREWSAAAQPNGYPDRIVLTYRGEPSRKQLTAVEHGQGRLHEAPLPAARD